MSYWVLMHEMKKKNNDISFNSKTCILKSLDYLLQIIIINVLTWQIIFHQAFRQSLMLHVVDLKRNLYKSTGL